MFGLLLRILTDSTTMSKRELNDGESAAPEAEYVGGYVPYVPASGQVVDRRD